MPRYNLVLVSTRDPETGDIGLIVEGMTPTEGQLNTASSGTLLAHDIIEHVNGLDKIGGIADELEALGAIWYVRGQHNDLSRNRTGSFYSVEQNISSDVVRMFREWFYGSEPAYRKRYTRPCDDIDDAIDGILEFAAKDWPRELGTEHKAEARKAWREFASMTRHYMRTGYRKAYRRWEHLGSYAANSAFWAIAEAISPNLRHFQYEGQRFRLKYDSSDNQCVATCKELEDENE